MKVTMIGWRVALYLAALAALACSDQEQPRATVGAPAPTVQSPQSITVTAPVTGSSTAQGAAGTTGPGNGKPGSAGTSGGPATAPPAVGAGGVGGGIAQMKPVNANCNPADKKPDPVSVPITQLQGYQSATKAPTTGPNKPVIETDPGLPEWTVYRPDVLDDQPHPIVAWAEGGCLKNGTLYGQWLLELASWGYIVLADGPPTKPDDDPAIAGMRQGPDGQAQMMAIEWLIAENDRPCSQYYHKVTVDKLAVSGQSCGGLMSLAAAGDKRITTAVIGNSGGLFSAASLHTPIIYLIGGMNDLAYSQSESDYTAINNVPIFNANMDTGHGGTWNFPNGGEFGRVGLGWLNWQLKGDDTAKKMFVGADCELCKSPSMWVVKKKMLD